MTASRKALIVVAASAAVILGLPWDGAVPTASAQAIQVVSATPPSAEQGTLSLPVTIKGNGFKKGAKAKFFKTGTTDPAGISVSSTRFIDSTQLVATIDVGDTAAVAGFDIVVQNTDGRTGKGTELFSVTAKRVDACTSPDPEPALNPYTSGSPGLPGYFDSTFGANGTGKVMSPRHFSVGGMVERGPELAIQNVAGQPRIVVVGTSHNACVSNSERVWAVARYLPDGELDSSFGSGGVATKSFLEVGLYDVTSVAIQPDNKIIVAGTAKPTKSSANKPVVVRFNENGSIDNAFGTGGIAWVFPAGKAQGGSLYTVAIQSDGGIVAGGTAGYLTPGYLVRLHPDGTVDTSLSVYAWPSVLEFTALRIQAVGSEERIVVAGASRDSFGQYTATVWRFTSSGAPDTSFGGTGMVVTSFHEQVADHFCDVFNDLAIDSSNRIVAAGYASHYASQPSSSMLALARYDVFGNLDPTFGIGGRVLAPSGRLYGIGQATAIQADGRIVVAGYSNDFDPAVPENSDHSADVWRFNDDGTPDTTFGNGGWTSDPIPAGASGKYWTGIALQPDGKIICGGTVLMRSDPTMEFAVLGRYWR